MSTSTAVVEVTDAARDKILGLRAEQDDADQLGLRIEIVGVQGVDFTYDLAFELFADAAETDITFDANGLPIIVPGDDVENLRGATLDLPAAPMGGLVLRNPNRPELPGLEDLELDGDVPDQVRELLEKLINPAIAAHGGWAELVGVEDETVVVRLGGGCQGCAMSKATVTAGIERTIQEHIPHIKRVVDVTDHASGENPYFN